MTAPPDPTSTKIEPKAVTIASRRRSTVVAAIAITVVAAAAVAAFLLFAAGDEPPDTTVEPTAPPVTTTTTSAGRTTATSATIAPPSSVTVAPATTAPQPTTSVVSGPPPEHVAVLAGTANYSMDLALDATGLTVFAVSAPDQRGVIVGRCLDLDCSSVETNEVPFPSGGEMHDLMLGPDGGPILSVNQWPADGSIGGTGIITCRDRQCTETTFASAGEFWSPRATTMPDGTPLWVSSSETGIEVSWCTEPLCSNTEHATIPKAPDDRTDPVAITALDGRPVVAAISPLAGSLSIFECLDPLCTSWTTHDTDLGIGAGYGVVGGTYDASGHLAIVGREGTLRIATCADIFCEAGIQAASLGVATDVDVDLAVRDDGSPVVVYTTSDPLMEAWRVEVASCDTPACASGTISVIEPDHGAMGASIVLDGELPVVGTLFQSENTASVYRCADPACEYGAASVTRWDETTVIERERVGPLPAEWRVLDRHESGQASGFVRLGDDTTVVGFRCSTNWETCEPVTARSADGETWTWEDVPLGAAARTEISDAVVLGDVAVVSGQLCSAGMEDCKGYLWATDFDVWTEATVEGCDDGCNGFIWDLVDTPFGVLANGEIGGYSTLWLTTDGTTWTQAAVEGYPDWLTWMSNIAPLGDGLLAVGQTCLEELDWECVPLLWRSDDGTTWDQVDASGLETTQIDGIAGWDGGVTVFGGACPEEGACVPAAWTSPDAVTWTRHEFPGVPSGSLQAIAFDGGLAVVISGWDQFWSEDVTTLLVTRDGVEWELFEPDGHVSVNAMLSDGDRILLAGKSNERITIWEWKP